MGGECNGTPEGNLGKLSISTADPGCRIGTSRRVADEAALPPSHTLSHHVSGNGFHKETYM